ncbi:hypothetical protein HPP92_015718 [Vanilla planifolia]|uniref:CCHC-type domain-containing protein n=1 Tax=Vanilla planifolia TaxID=51239 RepID=A0A835URD4_VANPL|nr:hypothetical protein HPP92_015718 [Vanilla planifolia]
MGRRWRSEEEISESESEVWESKPASFVSSGDDEEANEDLSLAIVNKARMREARRRKTEEQEKARIFLLDLSTSSADEIDDVPNGKSHGSREEIVAEPKKKRRKRPKKKKLKEVAEGSGTGLPDAPVDEDALVEEENRIGVADSFVEDASEPFDNVILRKLLRGPRYFDPGDSKWETCYNCGEEGHTAASCNEERRQRPCFVCGMFGHTAKHCTQGQDCFICRRRGHLAKDCPDKQKSNCQDSLLCLRCGYFGHDMTSCRNNYTPNDLKEIQCYVCNKYGHICCVDYLENGPRQVSCYNCAESGHSGQGCAKHMGDQDAAATPTLCYRCGQEGHFARGCTKSIKPSPRVRDPTPARRFNNKKASHSSKSLPWDFDKRKRKTSTTYAKSSISVKSRIKGGWIVDDSDYLPKRKVKPVGWRFQATPPPDRGYTKYSTPSGGWLSSPCTPKKRYNCYLGSASPRSSSGHRRRLSGSRFRSYQDFYD